MGRYNAGYVYTAVGHRYDFHMNYLYYAFQYAPEHVTYINITDTV